MSKVKLYKYQEEAFNNTMEIYKSSDRACVIMATGTGKSYVMMRLLEEFDKVDGKAYILTPNNPTKEQTIEKMVEYGLNNAEFGLYQTINAMTDEEIAKIDCDLIIADELHRTGASQWGKKFEHLINTHPNAKVFGVTATPIRSDGRDMAEEYFDGNKACEISLADAIVREILPMPLYVSALYTFEEEYQNMSDKIEKGNNSLEEKAELQKELFAAKQQLEKANGVPEIIKKYITNYNGKYIVFCKNKTHMRKMKGTVKKWFKQADYNGKIFSYEYYSEDKDANENFNNFQNNNQEGLKLLFVIDMLNEGLHLKDINGCILLRTTGSHIVYYQQIGRVIDAGSKEQRVILDLVSNFNSLKSFNLKKELKESVRKRQIGNFSDCSEEFELDKFDVVDLVQSCVDVFNEIDSKLKDFWWAKYDEYSKVLSNGVEITGEVRMRFKGWIGGIKRDYESGVLSEDKIDALKKIDFDFAKNYISYDWMDYYKTLIKYIKSNNDIDINSIYRNVVYYDLKIGEWLHRQRNAYRTNCLTDEQIKKLEDIGLVWNLNNNTFRNNIEKIIDFLETNNRYPSRSDNDEKVLAEIISGWRKQYKRGKLSDTQIKALNDIGFIWDALEYEWNRKYDLCKEYKLLNGCLPATGVLYKEERIGWWINTQKKTITEGKITEERIKMLSDLGVDVDKYKVA